MGVPIMMMSNWFTHRLQHLLPQTTLIQATTIIGSTLKSNGCIHAPVTDRQPPAVTQHIQILTALSHSVKSPKTIIRTSKSLSDLYVDNYVYFLDNRISIVLALAMSLAPGGTRVNYITQLVPLEKVARPINKLACNNRLTVIDRL